MRTPNHYGHRLYPPPLEDGFVYLDSAATSLPPDSVEEAVAKFEREFRANIHRGIYRRAEMATEAYESARETIGSFLRLDDAQGVVLTHGATESLNLVASGIFPLLKEGSVIAVTEDAHHSNLVPWLILRERGMRIATIRVNEEGAIDDTSWHEALEQSPSLVALTHISNVTGVVHPIEKLVREAHGAGAMVGIDAAQSAALGLIDIPAMKPDFLAFSGHKTYGPFGIGVLWATNELLERMSPLCYGGGMTRYVNGVDAQFVNGARKFEAGTPNISGAVGLAAGIQFIESLGCERIVNHVSYLTQYLVDQLLTLDSAIILGQSNAHRLSLASFVLDGVHPHDVAAFLDERDIAVRAGHHCAQPIHSKFCVPASVRASLSVYSSKEDIDALIASLREMESTHGQ